MLNYIHVEQIKHWKLRNCLFILSLSLKNELSIARERHCDAEKIPRAALSLMFSHPGVLVKHLGAVPSLGLEGLNSGVWLLKMSFKRRRRKGVDCQGVICSVLHPERKLYRVRKAQPNWLKIPESSRGIYCSHSPWRALHKYFCLLSTKRVAA